MPINSFREQLPNHGMNLLLRQEAALGIEAVHFRKIVALAEQLQILLVDILVLVKKSSAFIAVFKLFSPSSVKE